MSNNLYRLSDICSPKQWKTISMNQLTDEGYPVYGANGIIGYYSEYTHTEETILITCRGATCGEINICQPYSYVTGNAMALDSLDKEKVDLKYLYYYLKYRGFKDVISGSAQPQITRNNISKIKIYLPDKNRQMLISRILDKAQELIDKRKAQIEALDQLTQSVFLDMFGDPITNNKEWPVISFSQVIKEIRYGTSTPPKFAEEGYMFVRATNIKNGKITKDNMLYISHEEAESIQKCKLNLGELIFVRSGVNSGDNAVVTEEFAGHYGGYDIIVQIDQNLVNPHYLNSLFNSSYLEVVIKPLTRRAGQPHLNADQIKGLKIPLPPIHLQQEFTVNLKKIEKQKELLQKSLMDLETNFNSLMQRAFKGELFND
ncbi:restriction endonuclease subunit S [Parageobacillus sp. G301]|uniref:restriction endonuclease subunit S n=2 Tax=Anoxybacillaceae TaxID=3120669 RepID=UPI002498652B|nr:restriction endonuclease subunit S [Parageobacillus sp. G301]GLH65319.1 type I restriction-modification protein subunit S [Parageobacillus sp. G301]